MQVGECECTVPRDDLAFHPGSTPASYIDGFWIYCEPKVDKTVMIKKLDSKEYFRTEYCKKAIISKNGCRYTFK